MMKRIIFASVCIVMIVSLSACVNKDEFFKNEIEGNIKTYYEMKDGTWFCENNTYQYRLEISGRMPNAAKDSTFTYLSNLNEITFEQAYKAAGISSNSEDYFDAKDAVLVDMK